MKYMSVKNWMAVLLLSFLFICPAVAQTGFDEDVEDVPEEEPQAPINGYTGLLLIAGCALGYMLLKRETKVS